MPKPKRRGDNQEMQLLFVPYSGQSLSSTKPVGKISQQQHAALEYHRQSRLRKVQSAHEGDKAGSHKEKKKRKHEIPGTDSFLVETLNPELYGPVMALGAGRVDPFNAYCVDSPTMQAHEMLDHGRFPSPKLHASYQLVACLDEQWSLLLIM
jgi:hypothetical protein